MNKKEKEKKVRRFIEKLPELEIEEGVKIIRGKHLYNSEFSERRRKGELSNITLAYVERVARKMGYGCYKSIEGGLILAKKSTK